MKATIKDGYNALTLRNVLILAASVSFAVITLYIFGYVAWRRFVIPIEVTLVAWIGWKIARLINETSLSQVVNAASLGLTGFAFLLLIGASLDSTVLPQPGYATFIVHGVLWAWILFHLLRALNKLQSLPAESRLHVTEGASQISEQMRHRIKRIDETLADAKQKAAKVGVTLAI